MRTAGEHAAAGDEAGANVPADHAEAVDDDCPGAMPCRGDAGEEAAYTSARDGDVNIAGDRDFSCGFGDVGHCESLRSGGHPISKYQPELHGGWSDSLNFDRFLIFSFVIPLRTALEYPQRLHQYSAMESGPGSRPSYPSSRNAATSTSSIWPNRAVLSAAGSNPRSISGTTCGATRRSFRNS